MFDVVTAASLLAVSAPLMAATAALVAIDLGRPVLFRQMRPGLQGRPFRLLKFRTMRDPAPGESALDTDAERLTAVGRWLRSTSLDELPELLNVLRGEMSLVGPRPLLMEYLPRYDERQRRRHEVRPGLTGLAQVEGRNAVDWPRRLELDVRYVESHDLVLDLKILAKTLRTVLRREGIHAEGQATMQPFKPSMGNEARPS